MKRNILKIVFVGIIGISSTGLFAESSRFEKNIVKLRETKTETFKVYGNCGMCKKTIEGSLENIKGVKKSDWNKETKMIEVTYNDEIITLDEIKKKIAAVGCDTDKFKASDKSYNGLMGCCQYKRPDSK